MSTLFEVLLLAVGLMKVKYAIMIKESKIQDEKDEEDEENEVVAPKTRFSESIKKIV